MKLFAPLYERAMQWARHRHAPWYLGGMSFAESSFFPIPPDVMLAPMALARPEKAWLYAWITTLASVAGGVFGYFIGLLAFDAIEPWLQTSRYWGAYQTATQWFDEWGVVAVFIAGFSPIPYKVFTIAAGAAHMALLPFIAGSIIGRGARFFLVAALVSYGGAPVERHLRRYIDGIGWATVIALALAYLIWRG